MRLTCPLCGARDLREFTPKGEARARPDDGAPLAAWHDHLHLRDNPTGRSREYWFHAPCASWLIVDRDATTHEVLSTALAREAAS